MQPITIASFEEFVDVFGGPECGKGGSDVWRDGDVSSPMYGVYAAQAWLQNNPTLTYLRLAGEEHPERIDDAGEAGWNTDIDSYTAGTSEGGAYALFVMDKFPQVKFNTMDLFSGTGPNTFTVTGTNQNVDLGEQIRIEVMNGAASPAVNTFRFSLDGGTTWDDNGGSYYAITGAAQPLGTTGLFVTGSSAYSWVTSDIYMTGKMEQTTGTGVDDVFLSGRNVAVANGYQSVQIKIDNPTVTDFLYSLDGGSTWSVATPP
jgi:hypothetical protein